MFHSITKTPHLVTIPAYRRPLHTAKNQRKCALGTVQSGPSGTMEVKKKLSRHIITDNTLDIHVMSRVKSGTIRAHWALARTAPLQRKNP